jgi:hypothetical protein
MLQGAKSHALGSKPFSKELARHALIKQFDGYKSASAHLPRLVHPTHSAGSDQPNNATSNDEPIDPWIRVLPNRIFVYACVGNAGVQVSDEAE